MKSTTLNCVSPCSRAVADLSADKKFGLVFEDHIPETVALPGFAVEISGHVSIGEISTKEHVIGLCRFPTPRRSFNL